MLVEGPVPSKQIRADAEAAGHAWRTVQRAKEIIPAGNFSEARDYLLDPSGGKTVGVLWPLMQIEYL